MNQEKKVAILKSRINKGGILHVIVQTIKYYNLIGIEPDLITFKSELSEDEISNIYGENLKFKIKKIFGDIKLPYEWHLLWFNFISKYYIKKYDIFIYHNNTSLFGRKKLKIDYIHFPRKVRVESKWRSLYMVGKEKNNPLILDKDPFYLARGLYKIFDQRINEKQSILMANSDYTKTVISQTYNYDKDKVLVAYPPIHVRLNTEFIGKRKNIMTLGRFAETKRQLEQIEIAAKLPDFEFFIAGFINDEGYFHRCEERVIELRLKNVHLLPNLTLKKLEEVFGACAFFLHSVRNEPFGITAIQAIDNGCIPIVHDSGGQKETVPLTELRYNNANDAIEKIKELSEKDSTELNNMFKILKNNLSNFSQEAFFDKMDLAMKKLLKND